MLIKQIGRAYKISAVMTRYRIDDVLFGESHSLLLKSLRLLNPWFYWWPARKLSRGKRLRLALETLGPIFVKLGQVLSTRRDLLPQDIADELALLQDQVKPFDNALAKRIVETSLGRPIYDMFTAFSEEPIASASIAQVHAATLKTGEDVIVKILRPKVRNLIDKDIALLHTLASIMQKLHPRGDRIRPKEIIDEFSVTLHAELDLMREAANASQLARNFAGSDKLYIPPIYWEFSQTNVMVMERIDGIPVSNLKSLEAQHSDLKQLATNLLDLFFRQVFNDNFFHGDMHPGNVFVSKKNVNQFITIDYGIVGSLTEEDRRYIAENLLAFFKRDYYRVAKLHIDAGWVDANTRIFELEAAIRSVSEPVFEKTLKEISMGHLLGRLFSIARQFNMNIQPQLVLLQKTLLNVEGLARDLYPELDLWLTAKPFLERWMKEHFGPKGVLKKLRRDFPEIMEKLPDLPRLIFNALEALGTAQK